MTKANETSPATDHYVLTTGSDADWTHCVAEVRLSPAAVVQRFGAGERGDEFKVSREWVFRKGELVFTLYDWKSTSLYDSDVWTPEELWASQFPWDLHVGSKAPATQEDVAAFVAYLHRELAV